MRLIPSTIAVVCDCDDTLTPDTTSYLLEQNGVDAKQFWDGQKLLVQEGWDPPLAWMTSILSMMTTGQIAQDTNEALERLGSTITPHKGLMEFVPAMRSLVRDTPEFSDAGIALEFYIISSGFEAIIRGAPFAEYFVDISGGTYGEDPKTGKINTIKSCVTFTEKTKFLYAINKGIKCSMLRKNPYLVNKMMSEAERRIPFNNMIYIGDSRNDVPCFSAVSQNGGQCVGIAGDPTFRTGHALALEHRTTVGPYTGNYEEGSDLYAGIVASIKSIGYRIVGDMAKSS